MENLVDDPQTEGLVTFPDDNHDNDLPIDLVPDEQLQHLQGTNGIDTVKFEQKRMMNSSKTKILTNGFSSEQVRFFKMQILSQKKLKIPFFKFMSNKICIFSGIIQRLTIFFIT